MIDSIDHAGTSDQGRVRFRNEDFIASRCPDADDPARQKGFLFVVADGVGGSGAGDVASREAAQTFVDSYYASGRKPERALRDAFSRANLHVYDLGMKKGSFQMGTTLAAVALAGDKAYLGHVGDTRIYRVRANAQIEQMGRDHSEVSELVRMQILTPENARHHPRRNIITRAVGNYPVVQAATRTEYLEPGDAFVLCTDGLWEPVTDAEIAEIVSSHSAAEACRALITLGLERQATDNLSVQVVRVLDVVKENRPEAVNLSGLWNQVLGVFGVGREHRGKAERE